MLGAGEGGHAGDDGGLGDLGDARGAGDRADDGNAGDGGAAGDAGAAGASMDRGVRSLVQGGRNVCRGRDSKKRGNPAGKGLGRSLLFFEVV